LLRLGTVDEAECVSVCFPMGKATLVITNAKPRRRGMFLILGVLCFLLGVVGAWLFSKRRSEILWAPPVLRIDDTDSAQKLRDVSALLKQAREALRAGRFVAGLKLLMQRQMNEDPAVLRLRQRLLFEREQRNLWKQAKDAEQRQEWLESYRTLLNIEPSSMSYAAVPKLRKKLLPKVAEELCSKAEEALEQERYAEGLQYASWLRQWIPEHPKGKELHEQLQRLLQQRALHGVVHEDVSCFRAERQLQWTRAIMCWKKHRKQLSKAILFYHLGRLYARKGHCGQGHSIDQRRRNDCWRAKRNYKKFLLYTGQKQSARAKRVRRLLLRNFHPNVRRE
ncbi:MAG: hypothetical protein AAGJ35_12225, partial [Myxococcota bacterium]